MPKLRPSRLLALLASLSLLGCAVDAEDGDAPPPAEGPPAEAPAPLSPDVDGLDPQVPAPGQVDVDAANLPYVQGRLLVSLTPVLGDKLLQALSAGQPASSVLPKSLQALDSQFGVSSWTRLFPAANADPKVLQGTRLAFPQRSARGTPTVALPNLHHFFLLTTSPGTDAERASLAYRADASVRTAEPDRIATVSLVPNDSFYAAQQWAMPLVNAPAAWNTATGAGVTIAIIDTGVHTAHPDLTHLWANPGELVNGVDDDGNGYVDDVNGWDFVSGDNVPDDGNGHGTHVAGIAAATGNNALGVAGMAFAATYMPLKALNTFGGGSTTDLANAMLYAINEGADVINDSWGGSSVGCSGVVTLGSVFDSLVDTAHALGVVVVNAAGNSSDEAYKYFPANTENALTVSATDAANVLATYSNFGVKIDVAAPGGNNVPGSGGEIFSTAPPTSWLSPTSFFGGLGERYFHLSGTSMAAPHVSGLAALLIQTRPTWTVEQLRSAIRRVALDIATPGFDTAGGYGRIRPAPSLTVTSGGFAVPSASVISPRNGATVSGVVPVIGDSDVAVGVAQRSLQMGPGVTAVPFTSFGTFVGTVNQALLGNVNTLGVPDGTYTIRVVTKDGNGMKSEDRNMVFVDNVTLTSPVNGATVSGSFPVTGSTAGTMGASSYVLDWAPGCGATTGFTTLGTGSGSVTGTLATWNTTAVPDGTVTLRLTVSFTSPVSTSVETRCVVVDNHLAPGFPVTLNQNFTFKSPKVADLDGDGVNEIVVGASVFQPSGAVRTGWTNFPGLGRSNPAILDVDGDGDLEVVAADFDGVSTSPNFGAPVVYAYQDDKTPLWSFTVQNPGTGLTNFNHGVISGISAADVDGDGQDEVVFTVYFYYFNSPSTTQVFVLNAQTGALESQFPLPGFGQNMVALGDVDLNGAADLVTETWDPVSSNGLVYAKDASGADLPGFPQIVPPADTPGFANIDPVMADVDRDGTLEILVGKYLYHNNGTLYGGWPSIFLSRSTSAMVPLDNDCPLEIVQGAANYVLYWQTEDDATLTNLAFKTIENLYVLLIGENWLQGNPVVADVDGDGDPDILRPAELGHTVSTTPMPLYGHDGATAAGVSLFPRYVSTACPNCFADIIRSTPAIADVDGDGKTDMVLAAGGQVYYWNLGTTYHPNKSYWPMFQVDLRNTGVLGAVPAERLQGIAYNATGVLYDIDKATAALTNPRVTGQPLPIGLATAPGGQLVTVSETGAPAPLMSVDPATGAATAGPLLPGPATEGDLARDPISGLLYGIGVNGTLVTIDETTGATTLIGVVSGPVESSAIAFSQTGTLYHFDGYNQRIHVLSPSTGAILSSVVIAPAMPIYKIAGMAYDDATDQLYVSVGAVPSPAVASIYRVDPTSGASTLVGTTPNVFLSGLTFSCP